MLITHEREKLLNAIVYFAENTSYCGVTKLNKLLFLLDFEHFKQTGRSVTGLEYQAWKLGPVPPTLREELDDPEPDFKEHIALRCVNAGTNDRHEIVPLQSFDPTHFSKRELRLMEEFAGTYKYRSASDMVDVTHAENGVWDKVYKGGAGRNQVIPYPLVLEGEVDRDEKLDRAIESEEIRANYK